MRKGILWVFLLSSLAVNGIAGGYFYLQAKKSGQINTLTRDVASSEEKKKPTPAPSAVSYLPQDKQEAFNALRQETVAPLKEKYLQLRDARIAMLEAFEAENFSEDVYASKVAEAATLQSEIYKIRSKPFIAIAKQLTPDERKKFVDSFINRQKISTEQSDNQQKTQ